MTQKFQENVQNYRVAISELENKKQIAKGKKCPTCGHEEQKADPELEKECTERIEKGKKMIENVLIKINNNKSNIKT